MWGDAIFIFQYYRGQRARFVELENDKRAGKFKLSVEEENGGSGRLLWEEVWEYMDEEAPGEAKGKVETHFFRGSSAATFSACSLLLEVSNTQPGSTPQSGRRLLFSHAAFGQQSSWLVCSDQLGDLYLLDLARNKSVAFTHSVLYIVY